MAVRKFWLINAKGEKYDMTDRSQKHFFSAPKNLGFVRDYGYTRLGNADIITAQQFQLLTVSGEMLFFGSTEQIYEEYTSFMNFIRHTPLELHYQPANTFTDYYSKVLIAQLDKTEVNPKDRALHCPVFFKCNTHWLTADEREINVTNETVGEGKEYPLNRPYKYSGSSLSNIEVNNNGSDEVGFMVEIIGAVTNPQLAIYQNGARYGLIKLNGTFDYVKVNSVDSEEEIYLENGGSVLANPSAYQDLSVSDGQTYITFVKLKAGRSSLVFTSSGEFNGHVIIRWHDSFVSV